MKCDCGKKIKFKNVETLARYDKPFIVYVRSFKCSCGIAGEISFPHKKKSKKKDV